MLKPSVVTSHTEDASNLEGLARDQKTLSSSLIELTRIAEKLGDAVANDLAIERANAHDKFAWMLKTHLTT